MVNTSFQDMYEEARLAYMGVSWDAEKRASEDIARMEKDLVSDLENVPEIHKEEYAQKFKDHVHNIYAKMSRVMSAAVVGPANFPVQRNARANERLDAAIRDFGAWRAKMEKAYRKEVEDAKPQSAKDQEELNRVKSSLKMCAQCVYDIDVKGSPYYRTAFVNSAAGKIKTLALNGKVELVHSALEYLKELNEKLVEEGGKAIVTSKHSVWNLEEEAKAVRQKMESSVKTEDVTVEFNGGSVTLDFGDERLRVQHDEKPEREVIDMLKAHGFHWSPSNGCWQRKLTKSAVYDLCWYIVKDISEEDKKKMIDAC